MSAFWSSSNGQRRRAPHVARRRWPPANSSALRSWASRRAGQRGLGGASAAPQELDKVSAVEHALLANYTADGYTAAR